MNRLLPLLFVLVSSGVFASATDGHRNGELVAAARHAARALADRQRAPGYWTTAFTDSARYEKPRPEMNTFTNVVMIDLLDPVAKEAGVSGLLERTRAFLAGQIEADGLVRYHGRPDAPAEQGVWRCAITPDSDDTALVWRITPAANRELLPKALAKLEEFRAGNGLYRTWLAPGDRYQCIDPGSDPNPTDIGIQMNVFMWLSQADPRAALALCGALSTHSSDDRAWVYYSGKAPLLPMLRLDDVRKAGCPLELPPSRLETSVPEQGIWLEVARLLRRMDRPRAASVLRELAADGFARIRKAPPLLYHNDFTARTSRFYWSEDVGYALWLRLYFAAQARPLH